MHNYFIDGDWNAVCDRCGLKLKASALKQEWTNLMVCSPCFETRHPQTLIQVPEEHVAAPWSRPEADDVFIVVPYITPPV